MHRHIFLDYLVTLGVRNMKSWPTTCFRLLGGRMKNGWTNSTQTTLQLIFPFFCCHVCYTDDWNMEYEKWQLHFNFQFSSSNALNGKQITNARTCFLHFLVTPWIGRMRGPTVHRPWKFVPQSYTSLHPNGLLLNFHGNTVCTMGPPSLSLCRVHRAHHLTTGCHDR